MSIVEHAPKFDLDSARKIAKDLYSLEGFVSLLPSERDQNFLLETASGEKFVLKLANAVEERSMLEAQNAAMEHLSSRIGLCPRVIRAANGEDILLVESPKGGRHFTRLVTYLPGTPLEDVKYRSPALLYDLGCKVGRVDLALLGFDHPALHRDFHWDLANGLRIIRQNADLISDDRLRGWVKAFAENFEKNTAPLLSRLRTSVIHNDANDYNILVGEGADLYTRNQSVVGLIDFGDMVYSYTVSDLALTIAYAILGQPDPLTAAAHILRGYHATFPLFEDEITALFGLVTLRLCLSVAIAAEQQRHQPENEYLGVSQGPIRDSLPELMRIPPRLAEAVFREACGLTPVRSSPAVSHWLREHAGEFGPVLEADVRTTPAVVLDLSVGSPLVSSDPAQNEEPLLTPRIAQVMAQARAKVAVGKYDEARYLYTSPAFALNSGPTDETRAIHLGIDLFTEAGTSVYAPLDGTVCAFADNPTPQDYGPVVVLQHRTGSGETFYTLYGHLDRESLPALKVGDAILKGQRLAAIGSPEVNGGWTPHLHFQVITDLLDLGCDFPGTARPSQREVWKSLCPDPNLILGIPAHLFPPKAPNKKETLALRRRRLGGNLSIAYREPVKIVRGWKQYLFDDEGRRYIDAYNNVAHVGHSHPRVVEAGRRQMGVLNTNTRYLHDFINRYAERLTSLLPEPLRVCYFVNSGSEANELALRLARAYTRQRDLIVLEAAYHGNTTTLIDISPYKHNGPGGTGAPDWVHSIPIPDDYRGAYKRGDPQAGVKYAQHAAQAISAIKSQGRGLAGYIAESLPSVGGQIILPSEYLAEVYKVVRESGGVCIADEVQTGFGRTGIHFWGFELQGVAPDIVVLGKPIGNGHPIGAVITTPAIADAFNNGMEFFSTFGGNPVSCAIGLEVLDVVQEEGLQEHGLRVGERMLAGLRPFVERFPLVGDVRGTGLFLGVELVRNRETLEPAAEEASFVVNRLRDHGILLGTDGPYHNVVKIRPPMPFDESNADFLVATFEKILSEMK
jgi:4-aminobutyrate aminotransferase-like enzyme/Ser/Thr protein kinase RdoA (MazF antagonist)